MRLPAYAAIVVSVTIFTTNLTNPTRSQTAASCPYLSGLPVIQGCGANQNPSGVPSGVGGKLMGDAECSNAKLYAVASLYSYDDANCRQNGAYLPSIYASKLQFVKDASDFLPANWKRVNQNTGFRAGLYCHPDSSTLILAFRGSISLTALNRNEIYDWYYTNFLQHLGDRPLQYQAAEDTAELLQRELGRLDGSCGLGRPKLILTGHSKGGGQAQAAAAHNNLEAIVFNSDLVNPVVFSDWMLEPPALLVPIVRLVRFYYSLRACISGDQNDDVQQYTNYFMSGRITDIRMVNDPLTKILFSVCRNNFPHAPIGWLADTLTCSNTDRLAGHSIDTVVRELHICGDRSKIVSPANPP